MIAMVIVEILVYLLVIPIAWIAATPVILTLAAFKEDQPYLNSVFNGYSSVATSCFKLVNVLATYF